MAASEACCVLSFDYLDYDVYLNVLAFYRLAGFRALKPTRLSSCKLVVLLRGIPPRTYPEFKGTVHFYDYVCEHSLDLGLYFPNATSISIISLDRSGQSSATRLFVFGYLPVLPTIWQFSLPFMRASLLPLHISNYKPLVNDSYQEQLVSLIRDGKVKVYGSRWNRIDISTRPLSYLSANLLLSTAKACFGLMYPYQRGKSLSGRMWQAPLQGCVVFSELATNLFDCPGVIELENYRHSLPAISFASADLASRAAQFWWFQTQKLSSDLGLRLDLRRMPREIFLARVSLLGQHFAFIWNDSVISQLTCFKSRLASRFRGLKWRLFS